LQKNIEHFLAQTFGEQRPMTAVGGANRLDKTRFLSKKKIN
jgi:hypothetical protein